MVKLLGSSTLLDWGPGYINDFFASIFGSDRAKYTYTSSFSTCTLFDKDGKEILNIDSRYNNTIKISGNPNSSFAFMDSASSYSAIKYQINIFETNNGYIFQFNMLKGNNDWITYELCYNENTKFAFCTKAFIANIAKGSPTSLGYIITNATTSKSDSAISIEGLSDPRNASKVPILQEIPSPSNGSTGIYVNTGGPFRRCSVEANGKTYFIDIIGALED